MRNKCHRQSEALSTSLLVRTPSAQPTVQLPMATMLVRSSRAKQREQRTVVRRKKVEAAELSANQSFLQLQSVTPLTREAYEAAYEFFETFALENGLAFLELEQLDQALTAFMDHRYLEGDAAYVGNRLLCALCWKRPSLGRPKDVDLPHAKLALRGWKRVAPGAGRLPLTWELVCGAAMWALSLRRHHLALVLLLSTACYLRPSEMRRLRVQDVIRAIPQAGPAHRFWGVNMHQFVDEDSGCSKTGHFDEGVLLDLPKHRCITYLLAQLSANRGGHEQLAPVQPAELAEFLRQFAVKLRLPFRPLPYQLRHTGPSTDSAEGLRSLQEIKRRGRWQADNSVKRYEKAAQLTRVLNSLTPAAQSFCLLSAKELPDVIYGRRLARFPG